MENIAVGLLVAILLFIVIITYIYIVKISWNYTLPDLFGIKQITFYQAFVLIVLTGILFRSNMVCMPCKTSDIVKN